ncbi:MAG: HPF/RaiA family ribosome-associated protein [Salaquimonas sp.]|nr:HPF/RaiA family ribosome-associated protein [Salaquimonas sp.]
MQTPLELSFTNMERSDAVVQRIETMVDRLEQLYDGITSCHVFVTAPHRHHRKGKHFDIRIEVRVPGTELAVNDEPGNVNAHEDINVAIRDSFRAMERQLKKWKKQAHGRVKTHETAPQGRVAELSIEEGFGQIASTDGRLIYFHRNSVANGGFDNLAEGDTVEFSMHPSEGELGPQASFVRAIGSLKFDPSAS